MISLRKDLWPIFLYHVWNSKIFEKIDRIANQTQRIPHEEVYVEEVEALIDIHVLPVCELLWAEGIQTYFSCQGGPVLLRLRDGQYTSNKAYVAVLEGHAEKVCDLLRDRHAYIDFRSIGGDNFLVAVRFDPSDEANAITWRNIKPEEKNHVYRD